MKGSCCSVAVFSDSLWPHGLQHARPPVPHHLPEFAQVHVHWVSDAIQPSHPLPPSSLFAFNLSQHQGLFQWVSSLHQAPLNPVPNQQLLDETCIRYELVSHVSYTREELAPVWICYLILNHSCKEPVVCMLGTSIELMRKHRMASY